MTQETEDSKPRLLAIGSWVWFEREQSWFDLRLVCKVTIRATDINLIHIQIAMASNPHAEITVETFKTVREARAYCTVLVGFMSDLEGTKLLDQSNE